MVFDEEREKRLDAIQKILSGEYWQCTRCGKPYKPYGNPPYAVCPSCLSKLKEGDRGSTLWTYPSKEVKVKLERKGKT